MLWIGERNDIVAAALFTLPLLLLFNTVFDAPVLLKYAGKLACMAGARILVADRPPVIPLPWSLLLWSAAGLWMTFVYATQWHADFPTVRVFLFSIAVGWLSFGVLRRINMQTFLLALTIVSFLIVSSVYLNFDFLTDDTTRGARIGTLSFDSYPVFGLFASLLGLLTLYWLRMIVFQSNWSLAGRLSAFPIAAASLHLALFVLLNGQSRGEFLIFSGAATLFVMPRLSLLALPLVAGGLWLAAQSSSLPIFERLRLGIEDGFSDRIELYEMSGDLLSENLNGLIGLGVNGYQHALGLDIANYPHNTAIESLLSGGVFLLLVWLFLFFWPVATAYFRMWRRPYDPVGRILFALALFIFLSSLKSYSIFTAWPIMYLAPLAFLAASRMAPTARAPQRPATPAP